MASYDRNSIEGSLEESRVNSNYGCMDDNFRISGDIDEKIKSDSKWYVFDNLLSNQAEELLRHHGNYGTYLISHFHETNSFTLTIRTSSDGEDLKCQHISITSRGRKLVAEGLSGTYSSTEAVVQAVKEKKNLPLLPIFHKQRVASLGRSAALDITMNEDDKPPEYSQAHRYPEAARKSLPIIVPVYPTLRRMVRAERQAAAAAQQQVSATDSASHGCCWKACHTDMEGKWYKPHKAGPAMACLLVVGWILFLVFFGWIVGLALLLVLLLTLCACFVNFLCTGKCRVEEEEEEPQSNQSPHSSEGGAVP